MSIYKQAKQAYSEVGIDTDAAIFALDAIPISVHCWQGDDVRGFEGLSTGDTGGIQATGNHPGRAANADELRKSLDAAFKTIPGAAKVNLHAMYGDVAGVSRDAIEPKHFKSWVDWAKSRKLGLDFNPTMFAHPKVENGLTLSHPDKGVREFWIEHARRCRAIAAFFGLSLGQLSTMNLWVPDGYKDYPADQLSPRRRLEDSLDEIFRDHYDPTCLLDSVESKLFGIGVEGYTVGSHEFYMGYAVKNGLALCLDSGHFHPTEVISSKISALALYVPKILLHVSRPMRWDSDHVVLLDDELIAIAREVIRHNLLDRVHIGLDYFDGSIDRVTAWAIGARNMRKALLIALLEPYRLLQKAEEMFNYTKRLQIMEESKTLPWTVVWDEYCERKEVPKRLKI
ncbi:MAG: L-rhamnose isomerase [Defluviitaleaceae bacterium]|nr:L-rhamnose isomerase [Defluviitaleaceae bacterium]